MVDSIAYRLNVGQCQKVTFAHSVLSNAFVVLHYKCPVKTSFETNEAASIPKRRMQAQVLKICTIESSRSGTIYTVLLTSLSRAASFDAEASLWLIVFERKDGGTSNIKHVEVHYNI